MRLSPVLVPLALLAVPSSAWASRCSDIVSMVEAAYPTPMIVETIVSHDLRFTSEDVQCLSERRVPNEVMTAVRQRPATSGVGNSRSR